MSYPISHRNSSHAHTKLHFRIAVIFQNSLGPWNVLCSKSLVSLLVCIALLKCLVVCAERVHTAKFNLRPTKPFFVTWFTKGGGYHPL